MAASYAVTMCPHWFHDVHAPLVAATPNARYVEFFIDDQVLNFRRLIDNQLQHKNGNLILHTTPGLGFNFDEQAVKKYALDQARPWRLLNKMTTVLGRTRQPGRTAHGAAEHKRLY